MRRLGILTTYHYEHPTQLHLLRLLIDSIRLHVPREDYHVLVLVDDCSRPNDENDQYMQALERTGVAVYRLGESRLPYHHQGGSGGPAISDTSFGHAMGLMAGFSKLRALGCTHAWVVDADCVVLEPGFLPFALRLFDQDKVAVVTDYFGGRPAATDQIVDERYIERPGAGQNLEKALQPHRAAFFLHGFPNLFCALVDLTVEERFGLLRNAGWVNSRWGYRLFAQGYRVAYWPFFQADFVYHHGFGMSKFNAQMTEQTFGNAVETVQYGGKTSGIYHAGYLQLTCTTTQHIAWLSKIYAERPSDASPVAFPAKLLADPAELPVHGQELEYLRPFMAEDFDALHTIDTDPEMVKFLSWGPHGPEQTRAFLTRAMLDHHRWIVLAERGSNRLLGYGELRPVDAVTVGITYVIARAQWGRRLGRTLLTALFETGYSQQGYNVFLTRIDTEHHASQRVLTCMGPWLKLSTEPYMLKGVSRMRDVYVYRVSAASPGAPSTDPEVCHADRERFLYETLGMWR